MKNPKQAAILGVVVAVLAAVVVFFPGTADIVKPLCQAFGGCQDSVTVPVVE